MQNHILKILFYVEQKTDHCNIDQKITNLSVRLKERIIITLNNKTENYKYFKGA